MDKDLKRLLRNELSISVDDAARALGIHRNSAYKAVKNGDIPSVRVGSRYVVPTAALRKMLGLKEQDT